MDGSSHSQYLTAPTTLTEYATTSSSPFSDPAHSESTMEKSESENRSSVEEQIERSKCHWSHVVKSDSNTADEEEMADNLEVFKTLQMHPTWGTFFHIFGEGRLVVRKKFAEGGQAELYEAQVKWSDSRRNEEDLEDGTEYALKVFKKGTLLQHLQSQWPQGLLQFHAETLEQGFTPDTRYFCNVMHGTLLEDGRFAFLMEKEQEDLRSIIDRRMFRMLESGQERGPFTKDDAELIMYLVAVGMDWLHNRDIVHRDLKASNVLGKEHADGSYEIYVADYECSIGVIGTGFWRAPEILQALKERNVFQRPELFSKQADVYAYGMTCYEILTGKLPFDGHSLRDYDLILNGGRPEVPEYVDDWARDLLRRCWELNPAHRPSFGEILDLLIAKSAVVRSSIKALERRVNK